MSKQKLFLLICVLWWCSLATIAQNPIHFTVQQKQVSPTEIEVVFSGKIDAGWHVYSTNLGSGGPTSATHI